MEKGDILGHEFCGVVESVGPKVQGIQAGDRAVASFQIACGEVWLHFPTRLLSLGELIIPAVHVLQAEALIPVRED